MARSVKSRENLERRKCKWCAKRYQPRGWKSEFCQRECADKWRYEENKRLRKLARENPVALDRERAAKAEQAPGRIRVARSESTRRLGAPAQAEVSAAIACKGCQYAKANTAAWSGWECTLSAYRECKPLNEETFRRVARTGRGV